MNPSVANWQALDDRIFSLVSGDKGGAWSPVDPIIFSNVSGMQVTGEAKIRDGVVVALSGANRITLVSRQVQKEQEGQVYFPDPSSTGTWTLSITGDQFWRQSVSGSELLTIPLRIPHGAVLNSVSVEVDPADHTAVPTYPPRIQVMRIDQNGSTIPLGAGVANDTFTSSVEVYEQLHAITLSSIAHTVDRTLYRYVAQLSGEGGANFVAGLRYLRTLCSYTVTAIDED